MLTPDRNEAAYLVGEVTKRLVLGIEGVQGYWRYAQRAFESAQTRIVVEDVTSMGQFLQSPASHRYFPNREQLLSSGGFVQLFTQSSLHQVQSTLAGIAGSALVFAHAVFEDAVYDTLRIALLANPQDWIPMVRERAVQIAEVVDAPESVVWSKINDLWTLSSR